MSTFIRVIGDISMKSGHEVEWRIEEFSGYSGTDKRYRSPSFAVSGTRWCLGVCPNGETESDSVGWISVYLVKWDEDDPRPMKTRFTFGVKNVNGEVEHVGDKMHWVFEDRELYRSSKFFKRSTLTLRKSELLSDWGTLTLTCALWTGRLTDFGVNGGGVDTLLRDFADRFKSKKGSDVTLLVQGKEFPVHEFVLSARSPVFDAMFEADMKEKRTGRVEIEDCDPDAFQEFLTFLYSGKVENVSCDAFKLYRIADKYDVQDLKSECVLQIMVNLSVENVLDVAIFANQFNEFALMTNIQEVFKENYDEIISSTQWKEDFLGRNAFVATMLLESVGERQAHQKKRLYALP